MTGPNMEPKACPEVCTALSKGIVLSPSLSKPPALQILIDKILTHEPYKSEGLFHWIFLWNHEVSNTYTDMLSQSDNLIWQSNIVVFNVLT